MSFGKEVERAHHYNLHHEVAETPLEQVSFFSVLQNKHVTKGHLCHQLILVRAFSTTTDITRRISPVQKNRKKQKEPGVLSKIIAFKHRVFLLWSMNTNASSFFVKCGHKIYCVSDFCCIKFQLFCLAFVNMHDGLIMPIFVLL